MFDGVSGPVLICVSALIHKKSLEDPVELFDVR
jgi:hypothetical protein